MSCGDPHDVDCSEVLRQVLEFQHQELDPGQVSTIRQHLQECSPCLNEYDLEEAVRRVIAQACQCQAAPQGLRHLIMTTLTSGGGR